ncbi:protein ripply1-like isoform X1 [Micropterus dolomieu]|uniref:protein ripply1-like isoform X1 n=1 Tax=Micropterus dolomieu TaxID=147949 RepID=UPI001E8D7A97|nr:protein ripply1-like isoform X1 [Micropterus dolomieu]
MQVIHGYFEFVTFCVAKMLDGCCAFGFTKEETSLSCVSQTSMWRPWLSSSREGLEPCPRNKLSCPYSRPTVPGCLSSDGKPQAFQHPVRLFWPKSKSFDYLYSDGEALLRNFPIQATISFYDESDSEDQDEEDWEEDGNSEECLKQQSHVTSFN